MNFNFDSSHFILVLITLDAIYDYQHVRQLWLLLLFI